MIVALFFYHCFLIWTSQTTKEHLKLAYVYDPNPHRKHPTVSFWNTLVRNKKHSFTGILASCAPCTFGKPKPGDRPLEPEEGHPPIEEARIDHNESMATAGNDPQSPRLEGFMEVCVSSNVVKVI